MSETKEMSYIVAMKNFFGLKDGQKVSEFMKEVTDAGDREYFIEGLEKNGYIITKPTAPTA